MPCTIISSLIVCILHFTDIFWIMLYLFNIHSSIVATTFSIIWFSFNFSPTVRQTHGIVGEEGLWSLGRQFFGGGVLEKTVRVFEPRCWDGGSGREELGREVCWERKRSDFQKYWEKATANRTSQVCTKGEIGGDF